MRNIILARPVHDKGFVELVDIMGSDRAIAEAAWVSTRSDHINKPIAPIIRFLMRSRHTSPFEMAELKFRIKAPIFVARQWVRHRTASINEQSGRYVEFEPDFYVQEKFYPQHPTNKQMSYEEYPIDEDTASYWSASLKLLNDQCFNIYQSMIEDGISKEDARQVIPPSVYTTWYWKIDLHNLMHFLSLRMKPDAQHQIRDYAQIMYEMVKVHFPVTIQAFEDYVLNAKTLSAPQIRYIQTGDTANLTEREIQEVTDLLAKK